MGDSGFAAGAVGSPLRHSHPEAGAPKKATVDARITLRAAERTCGSTGFVSQQHAEREGPAQQALAALLDDFVEQPHASPPTESIPTIVARTTDDSRA
jgi:hypothetical protein